jgi:hypothetical protein
MHRFEHIRNLIPSQLPQPEKTSKELRASDIKWTSKVDIHPMEASKKFRSFPIPSQVANITATEILRRPVK